jgi:hypothetical protein
MRRFWEADVRDPVAQQMAQGGDWGALVDYLSERTTVVNGKEWVVLLSDGNVIHGPSIHATIWWNQQKTVRFPTKEDAADFVRLAILGGMACTFHVQEEQAR